MRKFFLSLICFVILQAAGSAGEIKFVQVTDVHYSSGNEYKEQVLKKTIADINKQSKISFVVFTGDNIDSPNPVYLKEFVKMANKLNVPYYAVIGNHDVFKNGGLSKEQYLEIMRYNNIFYKPKKPNYVFKKDRFVFIIVDGAKEVIPGPAGYYREDTLKWLDKQLKKYKNNPVTIFQHYPLIEPKILKSHRTHQAEVYLDLLGKHNNVIAVISGHYHVNGENMQNGIYHISTPSLLNEPNSYKIITVVTTRGFSPMIYTELREVK
ncbi:MAG: metallophosphoesterase [Heliobacteriaceae bacterium]|jgi:Icc protein|nr:metallophosphoesterase [Heliobacteriaceae bacterium]